MQMTQKRVEYTFSRQLCLSVCATWPKKTWTGWTRDNGCLFLQAFSFLAGNKAVGHARPAVLGFCIQKSDIERKYIVVV